MVLYLYSRTNAIYDYALRPCQNQNFFTLKYLNDKSDQNPWFWYQRKNEKENSKKVKRRNVTILPRHSVRISDIESTYVEEDDTVKTQKTGN